MLLKRFGYILGPLKLKPMACIELQNARSSEVCSQKVGKDNGAGVVFSTPENHARAGHILQVRLPFCPDGHC